MKTLLCFAFVILLFSACNNSEKPSESKIPAKDSLRSEIDTFWIGNKFFSAEAISKSDFDKLPDPAFPDTSENTLLRNDSASVKRNGGTLTLTTGSNKTISFKDNTDSENDDYAKFTYSGFLPEINQFVIFGSYMESFNFLLIDKTSGDTNYVCRFPIVSPDKHYFICGNTDLMAGFVMNGFDLYEVKDKKIKLVGQRYLNTWGPGNIKWLDTSTLFVERTILDTTSSTMTRTDYVKLIMK